jgi:hypothetical protein
MLMVPFTVPVASDTVMVTVPCAIPVTRPSASTVAIESSLELHTNRPDTSLPFVSYAVAVSSTQFDLQTVVDADAIAMRVMGVVGRPFAL